MDRTRKLDRAEGVKITFPEVVHFTPAAKAQLKVELELDHEPTNPDVWEHAQGVYEIEIERLDAAGALAAAREAVEDAKTHAEVAEQELEDAKEALYKIDPPGMEEAPRLSPQAPTAVHDEQLPELLAAADELEGKRHGIERDLGGAGAMPEKGMDD